MSVWIKDSVTHASQHQTETYIKHVFGVVCVETRWVSDPDTMVYSVFTRRHALLVAWMIIKAALTFRRLK